MSNDPITSTQTAPPLDFVNFMYFTVGTSIKKVVVLLKSFYVAYKLVQAIDLHRKMSGKLLTKETFLFSIFITEMIVTMIYDYGFKLIMLLYFIMLASNYAMLFTFQILVSYQKKLNRDHSLQYPQLQSTRRPESLLSSQLDNIIMLFHSVFISGIAIAFVPALAANCLSNTYPNTFLYLFAIQLLFSSFVLSYYRKGLFEQGDYQPIEGSHEEKQVECFRSQTKAFSRGCFIISLIQIIWGMAGLLDSQSNFLECSKDGLSWMRNNLFGDLFPTLHVAAVIMHAVLVIIVFYRMPKLAFFPDVTTKFIPQGEAENYRSVYQFENDQEKTNAVYDFGSNHNSINVSLLAADNLEKPLISTNFNSLQ